MFSDIWNMRLEEARHFKDAALRQVGEAQKQIDQLLDRIVAAESPSIIRAYETRIEKLEREKLLLEDRAGRALPPQGRLEEFIELALSFLARPWDVWENGSAILRRTVLRLAFPEPLRYGLESGYRTPEMSFPFKVLADISAGNCEMVRLERESLNSLFEALQAWEQQLAHFDLHDLRCGDEQLRA